MVNVNMCERGLTFHDILRCGNGQTIFITSKCVTHLTSKGRKEVLRVMLKN